jgi:hypothetical protein
MDRVQIQHLQYFYLDNFLVKLFEKENYYKVLTGYHINHNQLDSNPPHDSNSQVLRANATISPSLVSSSSADNCSSPSAFPISARRFIADTISFEDEII